MEPCVAYCRKIPNRGSYSNKAVYMSSKSGIILAYPTCFNQKKLNSKKGLIRNIQWEYAVDMTCTKFGIL